MHALGFEAREASPPNTQINPLGLRTLSSGMHTSIKSSAWILALTLVLGSGCRPEEIHVGDNPVPAYSGVPTVIVDAYLTRVYIDLIGREPLPAEMEEDRNALRAGDLGIEVRLELVDRLMGGDEAFVEAYDRKLFDDLSGRFLDGTSREYLLNEVDNQYAMAQQDSLAGGTAYLYFNLMAERLERTVEAVEQLRGDDIGWREVNRRFCENLVYDEINMNSFNFINATFDDLFGRQPTEAEFEQAYAAVEFGSPSLLFGQMIEDRSGFLEVLVADAEFEEGAVRWWAEKLLVRPISGAEMMAWRQEVGNEVDIRILQRLLIASDEYADFQ